MREFHNKAKDDFSSFSENKDSSHVLRTQDLNDSLYYKHGKYSLEKIS
jgi:hypothetical protein